MGDLHLIALVQVKARADRGANAPVVLAARSPPAPTATGMVQNPGGQVSACRMLPSDAEPRAKGI